jgi:hypothetical protein
MVVTHAKQNTGYRPNNILRFYRRSYHVVVELVPIVDLAFKSFNDKLFGSIPEVFANLVRAARVGRIG